MKLNNEEKSLLDFVLENLHKIRSNEMYRHDNGNRTHLTQDERAWLDNGIACLQRLIERVQCPFCGVSPTSGCPTCEQAGRL